MKLLKDFLYPGSQVKARNLKGEVVEQEFTPARVRHLTQRMQDMLGAGLPIPLAWEHQLSAVPMSMESLEQQLADKARLIFGNVSKAQLHRMGHGEAELDIRRPEDAEQLAAARFVSPYIDVDYTDPSGRVWPGESVLHLAATGRPVQYRQQPVQLSQTAICLSEESYPMADEKKETGDGEGGGTNIKAVIEALRETGMNIPDEVSDVDGLVIAIKASAAPPPDETPETGAEATPPAGVVMSQDQLVQEVRQLKSQLLKTHYDGLRGDIESMYASGRIGPQDRADFLKRLGGGIQLSQEGATGAVSAELAADIKAHKKLPAKAAWNGTGAAPATGGGGGSEVEHPSDSGDEEAQATRDADAYAERRNKQRQRA